MTDPMTPTRPPLNLRWLKKALMGVYGAQDQETAQRTGLTFSEVVEVRAEDVATIYVQERQRSKTDGS